MKRLLLILSLQLVASVGMAAIQRVQSKTGTTAATNATTLTFTLNGNTTVGNTLFVGCSSSQPLGDSTFKLGSNSFGTCVGTGGSGRAIFCYMPISEASTTILMTPSTTAALACVAVEYSGVNAIGGDIASLIATGSSTSNTTGTTGTTNHANELVVAIMSGRAQLAAEATAWLTSITNSFTSVAQTSTSNNASNADREVAFLEKLVTSTGTQQVTGTQNNNAWANVIATFYDAPTPTPTPSATFTPTATATATSTATATATATASFTPCAPTPTATATATPTNTPTPTSTPTPTATTTPCPPNTSIYGQ